MTGVVPRLLEELQTLTDVSEDSELVLAQAPGRVEILGNHTDYNGGLVLAATIERYVWALGVPSERVTVRSLIFDETVEFDHIGQHRALTNEWHDYVRGVFWALERRGRPTTGMTAVIDGSVPIRAGLSSSAALEVAIVNLVAHLNGLQMEPKSLAMIAFEAERLFCGVSCGIMDQFTAQLCRPDSLLEIHCANMQTADVALPPELAILIIDSGVSRTAGDALNERRIECDRAVIALRRAGWDISALGQLRVGHLERAIDTVGTALGKRVEHVVRENERVRRGVRLLRDGRYREFGELLYESHSSSKELFEVSHPNLDLLVEIARQQRGVVGARLTGAGLGGSVVILAERSDARDIAIAVGRQYQMETGLEPDVIITGIPGGVTVRRITQLAG